ncbi:lipoate--protein ligase family protein [Photobacterium ganghwense]|uniref:lipoate--protein ligase family protein n=1 Tax=Photobacterium ganghwense TaxID=320778 RepID=UPI001C2CFEF1|nr:lipoate--protein ligase [Photobacterium ganghwense]MBV1842106.1 lipoate--protein ligase [Photobacterium ganghwense]
MTAKNKLIRYLSIEAEDLFEKEAELLHMVQSNALSQALLLWQAKSPTLVLPAGKKWPVSPTLIAELDASGWKLVSRKTGGAPVPQLPGVINLSHIYHWPEGLPYDIKTAYLHLCQILTHFFDDLGVSVNIHATPGSYCDGDYNLNIDNRKVVGTAQRVLLKKGGGQVVLSQACILLTGNMDDIVKPVQLCNRICNNPVQIRADVHTPLFEHIDHQPSVDTLFQKLTSAFLRSSPISSTG